MSKIEIPSRFFYPESEALELLNMNKQEFDKLGFIPIKRRRRKEPYYACWDVCPERCSPEWVHSFFSHLAKNAESEKEKAALQVRFEEVWDRVTKAAKAEEELI